LAADPFKILFRPEVEDDLRAVDRRLQKRILEAIRSRLGGEPSRLGKPLGGKLGGMRRIRCGDYRIACQVIAMKVVIWAIIHRKSIYAELERRLGGAV